MSIFNGQYIFRLFLFCTIEEFCNITVQSFLYSISAIVWRQQCTTGMGQTTLKWNERTKDMTNVSNHPPYRCTSRFFDFYSEIVAWLFQRRLRYIRSRRHRRLHRRQRIQFYVTIFRSPDRQPHRWAGSSSPPDTVSKETSPDPPSCVVYHRQICSLYPPSNLRQSTLFHWSVALEISTFQYTLESSTNELTFTEQQWSTRRHTKRHLSMTQVRQIDLELDFSNVHWKSYSGGIFGCSLKGDRALRASDNEDSRGTRLIRDIAIGHWRKG